MDNILHKYVQYIGGTFKRYYDKDLFEGDAFATLPDVLIVDHHYITSEIDLNKFLDLKSKCILVTSSNLQSYIEKERDIFEEVVYTPVTFEKVIRILGITEKKKHIFVEREVQTEETKTFENIHVLVAEDNPINQKLIKIILENFGLKVSMASNGEEAFKLRKKENYDIIFMDIQMPVMSGTEATKMILKYEEENALDHIPIIALTANALSGDREKYMNEGMDDYTTKPLQVDKIKALIEQYS